MSTLTEIALTQHDMLHRLKKVRQGVTRRQQVRYRLNSASSRDVIKAPSDITDVISALSSISRSLRSGCSLRHAITQAGNRQSAGVIYSLAQQLSTGHALDEACADLRTVRHASGRSRRLRRTPQNLGDETSLVVSVIELAHSMGGDEARLFDSLVHTLIERRHIHNERQTQAATALSSMRMLTWLPVVCGLWIITESPSSRTFILHTTVGQICLVSGIALNLAGRTWARHIVSSP